jgi:two-component system, chemotaxis family, CheB/CheR fusion protein
MTPPLPVPPNSTSEFEAFLIYLKINRNFDFTGYKRASLLRRITRRMQMLEVKDFKAYMAYLERHDDEFRYLFDTILINVTTFFRDRDTWDYLENHILPTLIALKSPGESIRVWSAACASGEEPYSLAMLLVERLGIDKFREQVKIYATDVDEAALTQARQASYSQRDVNDIAPQMREKYFEQSNSRYFFRRDLRRSIIYGRHDLLKDAPMSRIDLLLCRNALMYFNAESQTSILTRFHFALQETGFLVVGKAEMLYTHSSLFTPNDLKRRVFKKVPQVTLREHLLTMSRSEQRNGADRFSKHLYLREAAFDVATEAQCLIDLNGYVVSINERARLLLNLGIKDLNRPLRELNIYNRVVDLRTRVQDAYIESNPIVLKDVSWAMESGEARTLEITVTPLRDAADAPLGISIVFRDLTPYARLQEKLEHAHQEVETAYEELQSTNEELETTNEELQSTIEELETTNEELQSSNQELETINEELHSTNEEMQTVNDELQLRTVELNTANTFLESILTGLPGSVVVIDTDLRVLIWSSKAEEMWGLRSSEVHNKNFLNLDIGLPVDQLRQPIRSSLMKETEFSTFTLDAINRRGKALRCKVTITPLMNHTSHPAHGVILLIEELAS